MVLKFCFNGVFWLRHIFVFVCKWSTQKKIKYIKQIFFLFGSTWVQLFLVLKTVVWGLENLLWSQFLCCHYFFMMWITCWSLFDWLVFGLIIFIFLYPSLYLSSGLAPVRKRYFSYGLISEQPIHLVTDPELYNEIKVPIRQIGSDRFVFLSDQNQLWPIKLQDRIRFVSIT